jgi:hypothetical protein
MAGELPAVAAATHLIDVVVSDGLIWLQARPVVYPTSNWVSFTACFQQSV